MAQAEAVQSNVVRVRIFVDFWNFQLSLKKQPAGFSLDWMQLGPWLTKKAAEHLKTTDANVSARYGGLHVYASHNPRSDRDRKLRSWLTNTIDRFPGVEVLLKERKTKKPPTCPACHAAVVSCPACGESMQGTVEKGIDTAIVTDMIRLAWEDAYDLAVLVSSDRDFIPAVEYLNTKGRKVINGWFGNRGYDLARKCWANINLSATLREIDRNAAPQNP